MDLFAADPDLGPSLPSLSPIDPNMKLKPKTGIAMAIAATVLVSCGTSTPDKTAEKPMEAAPATIAVNDFFKNPEKASFRISPNGEYFSYRAPWKNRMNVFVQKIGEDAPTQVTHDTIRDVGGYFWKGDRILYTRDINGDENFIVFSASMDGKDVKTLSPEKEFVLALWTIYTTSLAWKKW